MSFSSGSNFRKEVKVQVLLPHHKKALNCDVYFTDPYCVWQKGPDENSNGLLRKFYPKGRNISRVFPKTLLRNLALVNARFRKVLNFHSAQDL